MRGGCGNHGCGPRGAWRAQGAAGFRRDGVSPVTAGRGGIRKQGGVGPFAEGGRRERPWGIAAGARRRRPGTRGHVRAPVSTRGVR
ncbi:hypothetical protein BN2537_16015 [Streptomyces venezuelae]|nr:hypothetical protein BN2537_16015 [Streptomyces venezuelae]